MHVESIASRNHGSLRSHCLRATLVGSAVLLGAALFSACGATGTTMPDPATTELTLLPLGTATADACATDSQGGDTSCKDVGTWKTYAAEACKGKGLVLNNIDYVTSCGQDLYRYTKYLCCPVAPPTEPTCTSAVMGGDTSCKDEATWKQYAYDACNKNGQWLSAYGTSDSCGPGLSRYVKYSCCNTGAPPPPPPPPPMSCTGDVMGDDTSCKDQATWKQYAYDACTAKGLSLTDYATYEICGSGLFRHVKYACCK